MNTQTEELTPTALQMMTDAMLSEDFDKIDIAEFFGVLAAMDESEQERITPGQERLTTLPAILNRCHRIWQNRCII